ncbi:MAG TPA: PfkB family carbohydrate kinase [Candidatus Acidoferrales bacterium]|nr:PfkB family carbohydrate kinase [Candidatus Acidoferrales bacterium]
MSADLTRLLQIVENFRGKEVVLLGDFVADRFVTGEISRISREAPVLILKHHRTEFAPGGGANAVNNLADLGARVVPVAAVGDDEAGNGLLEYFAKKNVETSQVAKISKWTTPTKTRYLAGWTHKAGQQVLRVDHEPAQPISHDVQKRLAVRAANVARKAKVLVISDYGFGCATPLSARYIRRARGSKLKITLDSRYSLSEYIKAGISAATPNEDELEAVYHREIGGDLKKLELFGRAALRSLALEALVVTRGKDGMTLFERNKPVQNIPIFGPDEVADVTGAGDTVIAAFSLALAAGANYSEAAEIANYAGGIVVMKRGTATVTQVELAAAIQQEAAGGQAPQRS